MSTKDYTTTLLDMEDIVLKNIEEDARQLMIELKLKQRMQLCPACGAATSRVHDYHHRTIRDLDLRGKQTTLRYRRRRYNSFYPSLYTPTFDTETKAPLHFMRRGALCVMRFRGRFPSSP